MDGSMMYFVGRESFKIQCPFAFSMSIEDNYVVIVIVVFGAVVTNVAILEVIIVVVVILIIVVVDAGVVTFIIIFVVIVSVVVVIVVTAETGGRRPRDERGPESELQARREHSRVGRPQRGHGHASASQHVPPGHGQRRPASRKRLLPGVFF